MIARLSDGRMALLLGIVGALCLHLGARDEGYTRDEGYYFEAAENHVAWYGDIVDGLLAGAPLRAFSHGAVDRRFGYNHEHPPLMKTLFGLSWRLFHRCTCPLEMGRHPIPYPRRHITIPLLSGTQALRLPSHVLGGLLVAFVYLFAAAAFPGARLLATVAAVLSLAAPHIFFHAQLSCFDAPVAVLWLITIYCYFRSLTERRFSLYTGIAFGLCLATKLNAFFLPFVMIAHWLYISRHYLYARRFPPIPAAFFWMLLLGPAILFILWPWMWFDTVHRFREYVEFHLNHVYYNFEYLGTNYNKPPFPRSVAFVMTLLTVPATTLFLGFIGAARVLFPKLSPSRAAARPSLADAATLSLQAFTSSDSPPTHFANHARPAIELPTHPSMLTPGEGLSTEPGMLIILNALFPPGIIAFTGAPIFGGTKHWLATIPFLALLAGIGVDFLVRSLTLEFQARTQSGTQSQKSQRMILLSAAILACAPGLAETYRSHPWGLSHYNLLAGGPDGGADLGMNRQFWGYAYRGVLPWLNQHAPKNGSVYFHDANQDMINADVREGRLRGDILNTGLEEPGVKQSGIAMVILEKHFEKYDYWIWDFYGTARPSLVVTDEDVPLVTVYERPPAPNNNANNGSHTNPHRQPLE